MSSFYSLISFDSNLKIWQTFTLSSKWSVVSHLIFLPALVMGHLQNLFLWFFSFCSAKDLALGSGFSKHTPGISSQANTHELLWFDPLMISSIQTFLTLPDLYPCDFIQDG